MVKTSKATPAKHLSNDGKKLWHRLHDCHAIDDAGGLVALDSLCEAYDRIASARAVLASEGLVVKGHSGPKAHPATVIEHNARVSLHAALRLLRLSPGEAE